ncbi:unnamed protein product [Rotaria sp. Silwood2]|nr:unnamed protein product [Rotaria sp. Silwood2]CAF2949893.1 unnamed protein product [Rotaria sp. Silwood2]CAF3404567.1 unnamed protein product [Rotaria sp. Silwood2]CAF3959731.1 unnamed protein product [Rotaria sp. Silwood2]CAF3980004.1 unnamed protein product [Rotaria sp. Silwood2]
MLVFTATQKKCTIQGNDDCFQQATITCCNGYILQVQNQTSATCVKCLAPGESCYQTTKQCCPGYRCGSGGPVYQVTRPGDRCISNMIIG